jgi:thiol-disulfide isomerase/thioredoxin
MVSVQILALSIAIAGGGETVLLDFHAPWCAPCRSMEATVAQIEQAGYPVRKINVDRQPRVAAQYNVSSIPCFVLVVDGKEAGRLTGAASRAELAALFAQARKGPNASREIARAQSPDPEVRVVAMPGEADRNPFTPARSAQPPAGVAAGSERSGFGAAVTSQDLIAASVRLTIADPKGNSYGSGTIIDSRMGEALVLTCGHIFRDSQGKGQIAVDLFGPQAAQKLPGRLVSYDLKNDVALVSIRPGVPLQVAAVAPKGYRIAKGDRVTTVGCNNGGAATALETKITAIDKFLGPPNVQVAGLPVQGRSGGGLFAADGQVIGVCNAADPTDNEGLYAALASIHSQLDQARLSAVYERPRARPAVALASATELPGPGEEPRLISSRSAQGSTPAQFEPRVDGMAALDESQRVALAEVQKRGDGAEVICIVRSLGDPRAKSEVIKLDRASSDFLKQLATDRQAQEARHLTSLQKRRGQGNAASENLPLLPRARSR